MLKHERKRAVVTVCLSGELDHMQTAGVRQELDELIADPGVKKLVLDLRELSFMDSSGIGMIIGRYKVMRRRGGSVAVRAGRQVSRILELSGLYQIVEKLA